MSGSGRGEHRFKYVSAYVLVAALWIAVVFMWVPGIWINPSFFQICVLGLATIWGVRLIFKPFKILWNPVLIPFIAVVAWGLLQLATQHTIARWNTWLSVLNWFVNLCAFFLALQICASNSSRARFLKLLLYFGFVVSVISVVQYFSSGGKIFWFYQTYHDVLGPFVSRDRYAAFIELLLPLAVIPALQGGRRSLSFALISGAMFASVIAGASRAGALLITAEVIVLSSIVWKNKKSDSYADVGIATARVWLAAIAFVGVVGWAVLWSRFEDADPFKGRREMLAGTLAMVEAKPQFGFGLGNFPTAYPAFALVDLGSVVNHAHNDWAEWAADGGIAFSLLILTMAGWTFVKVFKVTWGLGVFSVFVHSTVDFPLQDPVIALWLFALMGAIAAEAENVLRRSDRLPPAPEEGRH